MCGIYGFIDPDGRTKQPQSVLAAMGRALAHRGPDDQGSFMEGAAWLGHQRLSIVDPSSAGRQPFVMDHATDNRRAVALANGEIYNHMILRETLAREHDMVHIPASDCAVLPGCWLTEGKDFVAQLRGMFAIAVWDVEREELLLCRDPSGQKPLYYAHFPGGGIAFASEPKALLQHPLLERDVDRLALRRYLTFDYVPGQDTIYRGMKRLPPSSILIWRKGKIQLEAYGCGAHRGPSFEHEGDAAEALWGALVNSVEMRLMSDVPLGVFLSGGLDSTAIVAALCSRVEPSTIRTFSIGFDDPSFDESGPAAEVAAHFGTRHESRTLTATDLTVLVPEIVALLDEPFADPSLIPTYLLSAFASEQVKVALGGEGGDELLYGYPTFYAEAVAIRAEKVPRLLRKLFVESWVGMLPASTRYMGFDFKLRRFLLGLDRPADHRHPIWIGALPPETHREALAGDWVQDSNDLEIFSDIDMLGAQFRLANPDATHIDRLAWQYYRTYLADCVLTKVDRASMAHGLEVRAPFLDPQVVSVCGRIPMPFKLRGKQTKLILRNLLRTRVPPHIVERPKKGFGMPLGRWLRGPLRPWMEEVLDPKRVAAGGLLDPAWVQTHVREHISGRVNHRKPLWNAMVLELWRQGTYGPS
jgi:asparagine synthase (glutamine-hydrolysing)